MDMVRDDEHCPHLENAVGWALYALEPEEEHTVRAHLATCSLCGETVREVEQVTALLAASTSQHEPPLELRSRLLTAIQHASTPSTTTPVRPPVSLDAARRRHQPRTAGLLAAAAAVVVVLGGATTVLGVQLSNVHAQQQAQAAGDAMVRSIVGDPVAKRAVLTNAAGKPAAMLVTSPAGAVVMPLSLSPNATNQSYVAWGLVDGAGPQGLVAFDVPAGSVGPVLVNWPATARGLTRFAISLEPGRVVPAKPSNVIASGSDA